MPGLDARDACWTSQAPITNMMLFLKPFPRRLLDHEDSGKAFARGV
jgi:hypothetical protein